MERTMGRNSRGRLWGNHCAIPVVFVSRPCSRSDHGQASRAVRSPLEQTRGRSSREVHLSTPDRRVCAGNRCQECPPLLARSNSRWSVLDSTFPTSECFRFEIVWERFQSRNVSALKSFGTVPKSKCFALKSFGNDSKVEMLPH